MNEDKFEGTAKKVEGTVQGAFGNVIGDRSQEFKGKARKAMGSVQNALGKAEDYAQDSYEAVQNHVHEKPMQSTLIALGIGFILGRLFSL